MNPQNPKNQPKQNPKKPKSTSKQKQPLSSQLPISHKSKGKNISTMGAEHENSYQDNDNRNVRDGKERRNVGGDREKDRERGREREREREKERDDDGEDEKKISSKTLRLEFDQIEEKLKNRDISKAELQTIVSDKFLSTLVKVYHKYSSLCQQASRIILQIYSHYPIRQCLYPNPNHTPISNIIIPLFLHTHTDLNQSAAAQCMQGLINQGNFNLLGNVWEDGFGRCCLGVLRDEKGKNKEEGSGGCFRENVGMIVGKWSENVSSIFMNSLLSMLLQQILKSYNTQPQQPPKSKPQPKPQSKPKSKSKSKQSNPNPNPTNPNHPINPTNFHSFALKYLVIYLTRFFIYPFQSKNVDRRQDWDNILGIFYGYVEKESFGVEVKGQVKGQVEAGRDGIENGEMESEERLLLYKWAMLSSCQYIVLNDPRKKKPIKQKNPSKPLFHQLLQHLISVTPNPQSPKIHPLLNFLSCLLYPYILPQPHPSSSHPSSSSQLSLNSLSQPTYYLTNEYKFITLITYNELFLFLLSGVNMEDMMKEDSIGVVVGWMFGLAVFCDQCKKRYKLEGMVERVSAMGTLSPPQSNLLPFQISQSILYRLLITTQKTLPKYSLKHYSSLYIQNPGIFHLYFIDQLLQLRDPNQMCLFLVELVHRWVGVQMRDFNLLGYVCKFLLCYLGKDGKEGKKGEVDGEERLRVLLGFMRELEPQALVNLNMVFYEASFSDQPVSQYPQPQLLQPTKSIPQPSNPNPNPSHLPSTHPPQTLSSFQQQSQQKSCGYTHNQKTIFIDRNFCIGEQLFQWSVLLREVYDDEFYYSCKYFYYLLTSAYSLGLGERMGDIGGKGRVDGRRSVGQVGAEVLGKKIDKVIQLWEHAIHKNKVTQIQSIFQMLACWSHPSSPISQSSQPQPILTQTHTKQILSILLLHSQKLLTLPQIYTQTWRQALKQLNPTTNNPQHQQLFQNYKKQQSKIKNQQIHLLRSINKFIENIGNFLTLLVPRNMSYEDVVDVLAMYGVYGGCWRAVRVLGEGMSRNLFVEAAVGVVKGANGRMLRKKLELYRELVFAYIEEKLPHQRGNDSKQSHNSRTSQNSHSRPLQSMMETELKLKIPQIFQQCIEILSQPICPSSNQKISATITPTPSSNFKNQKQQLYNKLLCVQILQQIFNTALTNKKSLKILHTTLPPSPTPSSKPKTPKYLPHQSHQSHQQPLPQKLKSCLLKILFRNSSLITKYQRKLIMHLRVCCLNWVADDRSVLFREYWKDEGDKEGRDGEGERGRDGVGCGMLSVRELMVVIWHFCMDQEVEVRVQVLSILTNVYKSNKFSCLQYQLYSICSILTLISTLQPKQKLKSYSKKTMSTILQSLNQTNPSMVPSFVFGLAMTIGYFIFNSKVSLPCGDIFDTFCQFWLRSGGNCNGNNGNGGGNGNGGANGNGANNGSGSYNRDLCYLVMCGLEEVDRVGLRFKGVGLEEVGTDLKLYYMNVKARRGWINCNQNPNKHPQSPTQSLTHTQTILKHLKSSIAQKNKHAKFLKSKKQAIFDLTQFLTHDNADLMEKTTISISISDRKLMAESQTTGERQGDLGYYCSGSQIQELEEDVGWYQSDC